MTKLRLLLNLLATIAFLLSQWLIPLWVIATAFTAVHTLWIQVALCAIGGLWLYAFRPWKIFSNERFPEFMAAVKSAIIKLLT